MNSLLPPPMPWKKGIHEDYKCFVLEVRVCCGPNGDVWSVHDVQSPEDGEVTKTLDSFGQNQMAHALLTEALRREAFWQVLLELEGDKSFVEKYKNLDESGQELVVKKLTNSCRYVVNKASERMMPNVVKEILTMVGE